MLGGCDGIGTLGILAVNYSAMWDLISGGAPCGMRWSHGVVGATDAAA